LRALLEGGFAAFKDVAYLSANVGILESSALEGYIGQLIV
jgi:hypothetical protein